MKNLKIWGLIIISLIMASCEKEDDNVFNNKGVEPEPVDLIFNQETKEDQMGKFSHNEIVYFNGEFWSVGGYDGYTGDMTGSQVWKSSNGVNWVSVTSGQFTGRIEHTLTVFDNKMWLIGGKTNVPEGFHSLNDVWYSTDGTNWTLATDTPEFYGISAHATVVFNNRLFVIKEGSSDGQPTNTVYSSNDGINWQLETTNAFPRREAFNAVVFNNEIYVMGGVKFDGANTEYHNDVFKSADGVTWSLATTGTDSFTERAFGKATVYDDKIWVIAGRDRNDSRAKGLWYSSDGTMWTEYTELPSRDGLSNFASTTALGSIWIFGGMHSDEIAGGNERVGEITTISIL